MTEKKIKYAKIFGLTDAEVADLEKELELLDFEANAKNFVSGFEHPQIPAVTKDEKFKFNLFSWGLIPFWVRDFEEAKKIRNLTLNARSESLFQKPAFRSAARTNRCVIVADAFYEYYHENGGTRLYEIKMKSGEPVLLAGIYDTWTFIETGEIHQSATIVTTKANEMMKGINNNPKADESRMPVLLKNDTLTKWMDNTIHHNHHLILKELFVPFDQELLEAHEVPKPKKAGI